MDGVLKMDETYSDQVVDWIRNRYFGKYRGVVTNNQDPTNRARLKVLIPAVLDGQEIWAMPCVPYAGERIGSYMLPAVGSGLWIEFEGGDPSYPIWTGCFWENEELPKDNKGTEATPPLKIIRSESGLMLTMDDNGQEITVSDENGENLLIIEFCRGQITIKGNIKAVVEAPQIELVENATHPVVFGDDLLQFLSQFVMNFNTHLHPGQLAMGTFPVTPMVPAVQNPLPQISMLSTIVKSG
jgi:hypothetical protein